MSEQSLVDAFDVENAASTQAAEPQAGGHAGEQAPNVAQTVDGNSNPNGTDTGETVTKAEYDALMERYNNLRTDHTRKSMRLSGIMRGAQNPASDEQAAAAQGGGQYGDAGEPSGLAEVIRGFVDEAVAPLREQALEQNMALEVQRLGTKYPDFYELSEQYETFLEENPDFFAVPNGLEYAFTLVRAAAQEVRGTATAAATAAVRAAQVTQKQGLAATGAVNTAVGSEGKTEEQRITEELLGYGGASRFRF